MKTHTLDRLFDVLPVRPVRVECSPVKAPPSSRPKKAEERRLVVSDEHLDYALDRLIDSALSELLREAA